jgi:hypothetical protein
MIQFRNAPIMRRSREIKDNPATFFIHSTRIKVAFYDT